MTLTRRLKPSDSVVFRELDGEAVLLNLDTGTYFGLDEVGTRIWLLIEQHGLLEPVCDAIVGEFEVDRETAERDVLNLADALERNGLVQVA
jgi:Coenzyme PQQ synthesis protein D (PqqD)